MAFRKKEQVRSNVCINNWILEQVNTFNCTECNIPYAGEKDMDIKITNFVKVV
jgi:hypothetical protein